MRAETLATKDTELPKKGLNKAGVRLGIDPDLKDKQNPWGSKYNISMCREIIDMFSQGKTRSAFCAKHTIGNDTFETWKKRHPLFNAACKAAHEKARAYFDQFRDEHLEVIFSDEGVPISGVNHALFNRMYNTRFNIPDKRAVKVKGLGKSKDEREMLKNIMKAVEEGELTPDEAQKLSGLIDVSLKVKVTQELEGRLSQVEQAQKIGLSDEDFNEVEE